MLRKTGRSTFPNFMGQKKKKKNTYMSYMLLAYTRIEPQLCSLFSLCDGCILGQTNSTFKAKVLKKVDLSHS